MLDYIQHHASFKYFKLFDNQLSNFMVAGALKTYRYPTLG